MQDEGTIHMRQKQLRNILWNFRLLF